MASFSVRNELSPAQAKARIARGEGQKTEFKESLSLEPEIVRSLGAFSHADGGTVFVGVRDDKRIIGLTIGERTLEQLANQVVRETQPPLHPRIEAVELDGRTVIALTVTPLAPGEVVHACGVALIRVGKTNQRMSPSELQRRYFDRFKAENSIAALTSLMPSPSWKEREEHRKRLYEASRGLFLLHTSRPSSDPDQVADIVMYIRQHAGADEPLTRGQIKSVEWHLGPRFFRRTVVKTNAEEAFRLEVSAYGPLLCLAIVNFDDGSAPIELQRYIDL